MNRKNRIAKLLACLAGLGMLVPSGAITAGQVPVAQSAQAAGVDVILKAGTLNGRCLTSSGQAMAGIKVTVRQRGREIAQVVTDQQGAFAVSGMQSGVYEIVTARGIQLIRGWEQSIAPRSAKSTLTVIGNQAVRGQLDDFPYFEAGVLAVAVGGLVTGIVALNEVDDIKSR